jgi:hypothetical protein
MMKLTASQINVVEEINKDKLCAETTLKVALNFHSNNLNEIHTREKKLWDDLAEIHNLDLNSREYFTAHVDGFLQIIEGKAIGENNG